MNSFVVSLLVFAAAVAGAAVGMLLRSRLPDHHLAQECKEVINLGAGLVASMVALVLGLLVASASTAFTNQQTAFQTLAANVVLMDRGLTLYGEKAKPARAALHKVVAGLVRCAAFAAEGSTTEGLESADLSADGAALFMALEELSPTTEAQKTIQAQAVQICADLGRTRWLLVEQPAADAVPRPFLVMLTGWLAVLFLGFGLFAPRNSTVATALTLAALSAAGAVFLVMELQQPFDGFIYVSHSPLHSALAHLTKAP